jgi:hypothetical protein
VYSSLGLGSAVAGINVGFCRGGLVSDNFVSGFKDGIWASGGAQDVKIRNNVVTLAADSGILLNATTTPYPARIEVKGNWINRCGWTTSNAGGISSINCIRPHILDNHLGQPNEDQMSIGLKLTSGTVAATVIGNIVEAIKAGGTAFVIGAAANDYGCIHVFKDNQYEGAGTMISGVDILPTGTKGLGNTRSRTFVANRAALTSGVTPPNGAWLTGDTIYYIDPIASGYTGSHCVSGGPPGTWKRFGLLEA